VFCLACGQLVCSVVNFFCALLHAVRLVASEVTCGDMLSKTLNFVRSVHCPSLCVFFSMKQGCCSPRRGVARNLFWGGIISFWGGIKL